MFSFSNFSRDSGLDHVKIENAPLSDVGKLREFEQDGDRAGSVINNIKLQLTVIVRRSYAVVANA